jgi:hypothetical protein
LAKDGEAVDSQVISQPTDVACRGFVGLIGMPGAVPVSRAIDRNEPHTLALRTFLL